MTLTNKSTDKKGAGKVCENEGHHLSWPLRHIEFIDKLKQYNFTWAVPGFELVLSVIIISLSTAKRLKI